MKLFVDTSALLCLLNATDVNYSPAKAIWEGLIGADTELVTHNYVLVETSALVLRRLGLEALRVFESDVVPILEVVWVTPDVHEAAVGAHMLAASRSLSLVDCVSFEVMRRAGLRAAFAFDAHFGEFGYELVPDHPEPGR
jgi:predicted nucleic acid-binding protein